MPPLFLCVGPHMSFVCWLVRFFVLPYFNAASVAVQFCNLALIFNSRLLTPSKIPVLNCRDFSRRSVVMIIYANY